AEAAELPPGRDEWPPTFGDPFGPRETPPEITPDELSAETIGGGILHHGCVIVRGLVPTDAAELLVDHIDRAFAEYDVLPEGLPEPDQGRWFRPYDGEAEIPGTHRLRRVIADHRGLYLADSPPALFDVLDVLERRGVLGAVTDYLGER